jgi:hypothetical protein
VAVLLLLLKVNLLQLLVVLLLPLLPLRLLVAEKLLPVVRRAAAVRLRSLNS